MYDENVEGEMSMGRKTLLIIGILVLIVIGECCFVYAKFVDNRVVVKNHQIVKGTETWDDFKQNTSNGKEDTIHVIIDQEGKRYDNTLSFDGTYYQYDSEEENKTFKRKHLLDLRGEVPVSKVMAHWVVLADQQYTLEQLMHSLESNDSGDWLDFDIIFLD